MQNWNNILSHIKYKLGVPHNLLEVSDDDIVNLLKDQVLPAFSLYNPAKCWVQLRDGDQQTAPVNYNYNTFILKIPDEVQVLTVHQVYSNTISPFTGNLNTMAMFVDPVDIVLSNAYSTLAASLQPIQNFEFFPPRTLCFGQLIGMGVIVEVNVVHTRLDTIESDLYNNIFKKMCLSAVIKYIIAIRNKFSTINTPFGDFSLNISDLQNMVQTLDGDIQLAIDNTPPDMLVAWL
jgi:hypothetical protein